jgi:hypothetical protein
MVVLTVISSGVSLAVCLGFVRGCGRAGGWERRLVGGRDDAMDATMAVVLERREIREVVVGEVVDGVVVGEINAYRTHQYNTHKNYRCIIAVLSLCDRFAIAVKVLRNGFQNALNSLSSQLEIASQSL